MNSHPILTDAMIETVLERRADHPIPIGLGEAIIRTVAETPRVGRPWWTLLLPPARQAPVQRLVWIVALVGLLLAATASAAFVGSQLLRGVNELAVLPAPTAEATATAAPLPSSETIDRHPAGLQATGVITPSGQVVSLASASALAVGSDGSAWVLFSSGLLRVDPDGSVREWSLADDAAFGAARGLAPSRFGGVWMFDATTLRLFDGETFTDVVAAPPGGSGPGSVTDATEGPDGQLWVTTEQGVFHSDGASWTSLPWPFDALPGEIGFDARGRLWVGLYQYPGPLALGVAMHDEGGWSDPQAGSPVRSIRFVRGRIHVVRNRDWADPVRWQRVDRRAPLWVVQQHLLPSRSLPTVLSGSSRTRARVCLGSPCSRARRGGRSTSHPISRALVGGRSWALLATASSSPRTVAFFASPAKIGLASGPRPHRPAPAGSGQSLQSRPRMCWRVATPTAVPPGSGGFVPGPGSAMRPQGHRRRRFDRSRSGRTGRCGPGGMAGSRSSVTGHG